MYNLNKEEKQIILDKFGKLLISEVRDGALSIAIGIAKQTTLNPVDLSRYQILSSLTVEQQEKVCDLLSETITDTIYRFLEMFEEHEKEMRLKIIVENNEINMTEISEKMGSEIACYEETGWIQRFSKIGRFVL